jgi:hypothetical protein
VPPAFFGSDVLPETSEAGNLVASVPIAIIASAFLRVIFDCVFIVFLFISAASFGGAKAALNSSVNIYNNCLTISIFE